MSNTIKKTNRKNKTNLVVNWVNNFFTIEDLHAANPNFVEITLRSRLNSAKKENQIAEIGCIHSGKGRPKLVFANTPVSKEVLEAARQAGVIFNENYDSIAVVSVDSVKIAIDEEAQLASEEASAEETSVDVLSNNINA
jgi:hypothetical protein